MEESSHLDVQGTVRGKCNKCSECKVFTVTSKGQVRCEYCDHVPTDHVRIIKLGACTRCNDCKEYMPESTTEYSKCMYCDCPAASHKGANELRKPRCPPHAQPTAPPIAPKTAMHSASQSSMPAGHAAGICNFPNCPYPKFIEGTRIHDFCSKTCAQKYQTLQGQVHANPMRVNGRGGATPQHTQLLRYKTIPGPYPTGTPAQSTIAPGVAGGGSQGAGAAVSGPISANNRPDN